MVDTSDIIIGMLLFQDITGNGLFLSIGVLCLMATAVLYCSSAWRALCGDGDWLLCSTKKPE